MTTVVMNEPIRSDRTAVDSRSFIAALIAVPAAPVPARYLTAFRTRSFADEKAAFEALLPALLIEHPGEHVAISQGRVVQHGTSRREVIRRFFATATGPVYVGYVGPSRAVRQLSPFRTRQNAGRP